MLLFFGAVTPSWKLRFTLARRFSGYAFVFPVCAISYLGLLFSFFAALSFSNSSGHITVTTSSHGAATPRIWRDGGLMSAKRESDQPAVSDKQRQLPNNIFFFVFFCMSFSVLLLWRLSSIGVFVAQSAGCNQTPWLLIYIKM